MERSLTVLLPVHNAQSKLAAMVGEVLEVVVELTARLELVIVDDGSTDATSEIAHELARRYPQVHFVRHGRRLGQVAAVRSGLRHSRGEMILLRDEECGMAIDGIARLWWAAHRHRVADDPPAASTGLTWSRHGAAHLASRAGYRIFDRQTIEHLHGFSQPARPNYLAKLKDFALGE